MSVQCNPLARQVQLGNWQALLHWRDGSSSTALYDGLPLIQFIVNFPYLRHHPEPTGKGIWGELRHIAD